MRHGCAVDCIALPLFLAALTQAALTQAVVAQDKPPKMTKKPPAAAAQLPGQIPKTTGQISSGPALPGPPAGQRNTLPPVLEPERTAVERRDLLQRFHGRSPIEGFYRLKRIVRPGGIVVQGSRGYLVVGNRHLSLQLYAPGSSPGQANIQAVFRTFRISGNKLLMSTLLGHRNKDNGDISFEPIGRETQHRFVLIGALLRVFQSFDDYLEFERIE